jgi:small-conductance mechanosensitive channel
LSTQNSITEFIDNFLNSTIFTINQTPINAISILMFLMFFLVFYLGSWLFRKFVMDKTLSSFKVEESIRYTLARVSHYIIMIIGTIIAFQFIGIDFSGLAVIFGLLSVGIGFGLQNVTSNFIAGLIILFERPIKVGDRVTVGDKLGDVIEINIRSTTIRTLNNVSIIVPNSEFVSSPVINWSHGDKKVRVELPVGVSYNSNLDAVLKSLEQVADEHPDVLRSPKREVHFKGFGDSSWDMMLRVWIKDPQDLQRITSELNCEIVHKFRENKVEIPFPQRDLHLRSTLPFPVVDAN